MLIAQMTEAEVCGAANEAGWLCQVVFRATGSDLLARGSDGLSTLLTVILIVLVAIVVSRLLRRLVGRFTARMEARIEERLHGAHARGAILRVPQYRTRRLQRLHAVGGVLRGAVAVVVWVAAVLLIVGELGVRLQPILAGAGLIGIVVGFGAQQLVRDVLAGIAMLIEDQYGVGDWIEVDGVIGEVERVGLRATSYRDIDGVLHHQLNGSMSRVGNLSQELARSTLDVPISLDADIPAVKALIHRVASDLADDPVWGADVIGEPEIWGVQELGPQGVVIRVGMTTKPLRNWDITRQLRERLKLAFDRADVQMPGQLVDLGGRRGAAPVSVDRAEQPVPRQRDRGGRQRGRVPPDVGPYDHPDAGGPASQPSTALHDDSSVDTDGIAAVEPSDENPTGDLTTELRLRQGPRARPD